VPAKVNKNLITDNQRVKYVVEDGRPKTEVGSRKSEDRRPKSEVGRQKFIN